ncbi:hypothetical protein EGW08_010609 [Elysia chlorotica]|uniref:F-box domain-containing protein n=1 Tax=Elysia chlorotica TaxID=188477 RepID=A0A433TJE0_ELYCH|nr:hypothetical protein EGW08_010609 [Elysia chlorotica]
MSRKSSKSSVSGRPSNARNNVNKGLTSSEWVAQCTPWLDSEGALYQRQDVSIPPLKDFFLIWVDPYQVVFTNWQIQSPAKMSSHRGAICWETDYQGFKNEPEMRGLIESRTGPAELDFLDVLLQGRINFLDRMPPKLQMLIISYLDIKAVAALAGTSKYYKKLCYSDTVWKALYHRSGLNANMTAGLLETVESDGWRVTYIMAHRIRRFATPLRRS